MQAETPVHRARPARTASPADHRPADGLDHLGLLTAAQAAFVDDLAAADPGAPVPGCAPWRVADLALHLAGVHRWAAACAMGLQTADDDPGGPRDTAGLVRVYRWAAQHVAATLAAAGDGPALTLDGPGPATFWRRRQLHETLVHLVDLRQAGGADAGDAAAGAAPAVWADTVDEVVTVMHPRQVRLGRAAPPTTGVALVADDAARAWVLGAGAPGPVGTAGTADTGRAGAVAAGRAGAVAGASVVVRGPAWALALLLWRRTGPDDPSLAVDGDRGALLDALDRALVP